jgi:hypothetical protein
VGRLYGENPLFGYLSLPDRQGRGDRGSDIFSIMDSLVDLFVIDFEGHATDSHIAECLDIKRLSVTIS